MNHNKAIGIITREITKIQDEIENIDEGHYDNYDAEKVANLRKRLIKDEENLTGSYMFLRDLQETDCGEIDCLKNKAVAKAVAE